MYLCAVFVHSVAGGRGRLSDRRIAQQSMGRTVSERLGRLAVGATRIGKPVDAEAVGNDAGFG